ncbi:unnamed protein product [Clonostachys rosea]|uniref:Receptor L-domain domain-containing protein n=1 Tax=Bionectria ochroleuca TaxID=29856 RepID=A0ABY6V0F0_BIOOC|nr:unnamed protein product [Clonostachys rosea]
MSKGWSLIVLLLAAVQVTASEINCNGNVTIRNSEDAKTVRENCKTIAGTLDLDIFETFNLDGLEEVLGDVVHRCPTKEKGLDYCMDASTTFNISSSTLKMINGSLALYYYRVENLDFPALNKVRREISLYNTFNLTHVNLANLEYFGTFLLQTPSLIELKLDKFKEFTSLVPYVNIWDTGKLESFDEFFQNPVNPYNVNNSVVNPFIDFHPLNVRSLTLGWTRMPSMNIRAKSELTLTLGGPKTEQMEFEGTLKIGPNVTAINRHDNLKNLTVERFDVQLSAVSDLDLSLNQVTTVSVYGNPQLRQLRLPSMAQSWKNLTLNIGANDNLLLSVVKDGSDEIIWHWPTGDMASVAIHGNMTSDFL